MKSPLTLFSLVFCLSLASCGNQTGPAADKAAKNGAVLKAPSQDHAKAYVANNLTIGEWKKGVFQKSGHTNQFYTLELPGESVDIKEGDKLRFAKTGIATVTKVARSAADSSGVTSVFVVVDKDLDPDGDGFPNPIISQ